MLGSSGRVAIMQNFGQTNKKLTRIICLLEKYFSNDLSYIFKENIDIRFHIVKYVEKQFKTTQRQLEF